MRLKIKAMTMAIGTVIAVTSAPYAQAARVAVTCKGASTTTCYFTFFYVRGGTYQNFTMVAGTRDYISGVEVGDQFCMSTSGPNDPNTCRRGVLQAADLLP